ncbi:MAG: class I SAM-dependent methyltransferase [Nitrospirae bacterium]|nr:class I SAM-dependent methyltransferase [Candidatus Manganitrophaceae bacterium]
MAEENQVEIRSREGQNDRPGGYRPFDKNKGLFRVSPAFRICVSELRDFLGEMKQQLDMEEAKIGQEDPGQRTLLERKLLQTAEKIITHYLDRFVPIMNQIVVRFSPEEHLIHRNFFQQHLHPFLLLSPFVKRAYSKPLGYAGDYEMMDMLYRSHDQGESLFARVINRYCCQVTAARSVVKRVPYMLDRIGRTIDQVSRHKEAVSFTSIGCGPAMEIQELIQRNPMSDPCRVTLVDTEPEALHHCHERISRLKEVTQSRTRVSFLNRSIHQLILDPDMTDSLGSQDLIYAMGLFDYLPTHIAKRLLQKLYRLLSDEGELIIGNLNASNDARYFMEYGAEWYVIYRTSQEMMEMAEGLTSPLHVEVEADAEEAQLYLIVKKWKGLTSPIYRGQEATSHFYGKN